MDELVNILLVEDNASDVRLTLEARSSGRMLQRLSTTRDGVKAKVFFVRRDSYKP